MWKALANPKVSKKPEYFYPSDAACILKALEV